MGVSFSINYLQKKKKNSSVVSEKKRNNTILMNNLHGGFFAFFTFTPLLISQTKDSFLLQLDTACQAPSTSAENKIQSVINTEKTGFLDIVQKINGY